MGFSRSLICNQCKILSMLCGIIPRCYLQDQRLLISAFYNYVLLLPIMLLSIITPTLFWLPVDKADRTSIDKSFTVKPCLCSHHPVLKCRPHKCNFCPHQSSSVSQLCMCVFLYFWYIFLFLRKIVTSFALT